MQTPDLEGYEQTQGGVYYKPGEESDEMLILLRAYIPTKEEVIEHVLAEAEKIDINKHYDDDELGLVEHAQGLTQALLYALPQETVLDFRTRGGQGQQYLEKYLLDPREENGGHLWYIDVTCGLFPKETLAPKASNYVSMLPHFEDPYGPKWFMKLMLKDDLLSTDVDVQELVSRGPLDLGKITRTIGKIFSRYKLPEHTRGLQDVSDEMIQLPASELLKRLLLTTRVL
ncbi:hypothetical protein GOV10_06185, partial [Candidatus Woesearchaeota archaeon]|nr:hypothetical protein [Candidatus Woesearchaeota archaeon]